MVIILTAQQAARVRGRSPTSPYAAIDPVPLRDGTFMVSESVLNDPAHADVAAFLKTLPTATVTAADRYFAWRTGDTRQTFLARHAQDAAEVAAKALPRWRDIGVRQR